MGKSKVGRGWDGAEALSDAELGEQVGGLYRPEVKDALISDFVRDAAAKGANLLELTVAAKAVAVAARARMEAKAREAQGCA